MLRRMARMPKTHLTTAHSRGGNSRRSAASIAVRVPSAACAYTVGAAHGSSHRPDRVPHMTWTRLIFVVLFSHISRTKCRTHAKRRIFLHPTHLHLRPHHGLMHLWD